MNKIFKVVWNRTIGSFVVTSELAKGRVKSSSEGAEGDMRASEEGRLKTLFRLTALSATLLGLSEGAWAAIPEQTPTGGAVFAIGTGTTSAHGTGALSLGHNAQAKNNGALAIGPNSSATNSTISNGNNAIAIGVNLRADGSKAIGIGADTTVSGTGAIAIGNNDSGRMANQGVNGNGAIGVGSNLTANGNNAIAVGTEAQAKESSTVAVGANTQATGVEAVAIGKGAASTASKALAFGQGAQAKASDAVAVGTGAQATLANSIAIGKNSVATGVNNLAPKDRANVGNAVAIGPGVQALGEDSVAIGVSAGANLTTASTKQSLAIGWTAKATGLAQAVAIGPDAIASGAQSTSIGNNTRAIGDSSIAIGGDDWNVVRTKTVAAAGNKQVHQVYQELTGMEMKQQGEAYNNPFKGTTAGDAAVAIGVAALAEGTLSTAFGSGTSASGVGASAFGVGATASKDKSVAIGAGSHTNTDATRETTATVNGITYSGFAGATHITSGSQVSFGSAGYERQLKHVAPGAITSTSTDAINGSQLYALHAGSGNIAKAVADALGGGAAVGTDPTNRQGTVTLPSYNVLKGSATPNTVGNGTVNFNATPARSVADALTNLNTYVNQGFAVKDNAGTAKGIVTPEESVQFADGNATTVTVDTEANGNTKIKYDVKVDGETVKIENGKLTAASQTHFYSVKNEDKTKGNYNNEGATGENALAAGVDASATANGTTAVGLKAQASAESAIAVGSETKAAAKNAVVIGNKASVEAATGSVNNVNGTTTGEGSVAVGAASKASGTNATAVGQAANAFGQNSFAGGQNSKASGKSSVAIGDGANATNDSSSAVGPYAQATKSGASAFGYYANAFGENSLAAGRNAQAANANAVALGNESKATGQNTIAFGNNANASQNQAIALGRNTAASAGYTVALGDEAKATATKAIAFGTGAKATQGNAVAIGAGSTTETNATSVNEATVNNLKYSGFAGGNNINPGDQVSFGSAGFERQLKHVAPGAITSTSTDAINGSQLYAVQNVLGNTAKTVKNVLGGDAEVGENGSITMSNIGNTGAGNVHDAIKSVKETAEKGWNLKANEEATSEKIAAGDTVTVKQGKNIRVKRSSKELTIETADDVAFNKVTVGNSVLTTDGLTTPQVTAGDSVLGNNGLTIVNGAANAPVSLTKDGLNNGGNKVTKIADGVADTDAASYKQVKAAKTEVQKGTNVVSVTKTDGADGHAIYTVNAKGAAVSAEGADNGLKLTSSENTTTNLTTYNLDLSDKTKDSLKKADSALQNIGVQVNGEDAKTLNQADSKLNFVNGTGTTAENKGGTVTFNVNKSTLTTGAGGVVSADTAGDAFATAADVAKAINKAVVDSEKTSVVAAGDNTHVAVAVAGNQTTYTVHADNTTVSVKDGGKLKLGSSEKANANQTKTTNYELDLTDDTKAEIQKGVDAKNIVDTKGITFSGNSGSPVTKKLDETLAIKGDDTNVVTEAGTDGIKVKLKDEITVQTVNADKLKAGDSVLTNDGLNIANGDNPVSLTKSGLNNGGNKITKVAKGENEDDAVNYAQLKELADKGLTFDADGNTSTSSKKLGERVGIKGGNNITTSADNDNVTVKLNDDITLTSVTATTLKAGDSTLTNAGLVTPKVTAGNSVLEDNGLTISNGASNAPVSLTKNGLDNGNNKIAKVAKGTADTDAVNVEQIKPLATALNTTVGTDGTVGKPSFTVKQADGTAGTAVHTVQDALNKVGDELNKGLNIAADNGNADKVNLGETVTYTSKDKNIVTTVGSNEIDFSLAEKITIGKTDGKKVVIDGTNGTVSGLTNKTLGDTGFATKGQAATEEQINAAQTNLANVLGTGSTNQNGTVTVTDIGETGKTTVSDAIKSVKETAEKGWNLQANSDAAEKVAAGETVTFKDGKNIKVTRDGKNITVATSDDVEFNKVTVGGSELTGAGLNTPKVTAGDSELNGSGLTISNGTAGSSVSLTKNGLNNGGNKITKVAEGALAVDSTDAVNGAQLYRVDQKADTNAANIAKGINIGGTSNSKKYALGDTINIKGDSNIISETVEGGVQLKLADTVKIGQDTGKPVSIDGTTGTVSGLSNTTLGATGFATSNKAATEAQLDATQANLKTILGGNAENTNGNIAMSNIGGTNQNTVHDAIKSVKETAEKGWKLKVNEETSAQAEKISPDDEVAIKQGKNITVTREGKNITVATSDDVAFNKVTVGDSVLNGNGLTIANGAAKASVSLTKNGLDNGGNKVSNIAKGTADTDAVNVEQLKPIAAALNTTVNPTTGEVAAPAFTVTKADGTKNTAVGTVQEALDKVGEELKKGLVIAADEGSSEKVNLGDTVTYTGTDGNIKTKTLSGGKVDFGLNDKVTLGKAGSTPIVLDGTNGTVSGLTNKTLGGTDFATKGQAATEEQLNETQVNLKNILGGEAKNENGNVSTANIGDTGKGNIHEAIKSVKETAEKGWNLQANEGAEEKVAAGETVNFKDGKNIKVTRDGKNITVATSDDVEFAHVKADSVEATSVVAESVIAGNSVLTTEGLKIGADSSPNQVSLTTAGLNNGGNKIAKVAKGTEDTDGVNVSQIKPLAEALNTTVGADGSVAAPNFTVKQADGTVSAPVHTVQDALNKVGDELNKGLKIAADAGSTEKVNLGDTVTYTSTDGNIKTKTLPGGKVDFGLNDKVTLGKAGSTPIVLDGTNGTVSGLTNKTLGGTDFATKGQAATEEQLNETQVNLKNILGGEAKNENGNVSTANIGDTGKGNIHEAIKSVKETAEKGWNLQANEGAEEKVAAGETVNFKDGKNIKVTRDGKNITVATSDDVEFAHVKADSVEATSVVAESVIAGNSVLTTDGLKIGADGSQNQVSLTTAGLNNGGNKITNVAKGAAETDAVNVSQLNPIAKALNTSINPATGAIEAPVFTVTKADGTKHDAVGTVQDALDKVGEEVGKGLNIVADNGSSEKVNLGDTVKYTSKDKNIVTTSGTGKEVDFSLAEKVTIGKDAANGGKPVVIDGKEGIVSGLTNQALGGTGFATKGQAATEEQLNETQANLAKLLGGNAANDKGNVATNDIGGTGKDNVHDAIAAVKETVGKGWNLKANDEADSDSENIASGDTVTVKQGKNIRVKRSGKELTVETSDDVEFGTVSATTVLADSFISGNSVLSGEGLKIGADGSPSQVSLTNAGLNNGGNKVSDIAAGEADTDAVNVAQLKAAAAKATSKVDSGNDNIVVTPEQNADGSTTYKVATAPNLKADSFTAGDTVVNKDGVKVGDKVALGKDGLKAGDVNITADGINAGNKAISNVAAGVKDTDAANVGQLNRLTAAAKTEVEAGTNIAGVTSKQGANGQTVYTVNADGASVSAGSDNIVVTKGNKDADNVTDYAVDLSKAVKADIAKGVAAKDAVDNKGISFAGDSGTTVANKLGDTVAVKGDANITTTAGANGIQVGLNKDLKVDSVKAGDTVVNNNGVNVGDKVALGKDGLKAGDVNITAEGINAGGKKVTGVAAGTVAAGSTDAVNGGQLHQVYELIGSNGGNVNTAPPAVEADGKAGLGNIKNITLVDNSNNPNVTNVTNETKIAQSNGYSLVTYNVEDQGMYVTNNVIEAVGRMNEQGIKFFHTNDGEVNPDVQARNGEDSSASGAYATAVGYQAASKGTNAIAIGKGAKANAENTIAIGTGNIVSGKNSGAIGDPTVVSGNSAYSIGNNNNVSADNAYALGSNIKATVKDSVYLGDRAQTQGIRTADAAKGEAYTYGGLNDKAVAGKAGSTAAANKVAGVVTVGNGTDETRQVQGVAAGVVSADSTDAINGSQLYYTNQAIANVATQATAAKTEVTAGKNVVVNQTTGNSGQTVYNVATADKLDVTSVTAGGVTVNAQGVSIAAPTTHNPANTVSLSPIGLNNGGQRITNVAPAKEGTDAVNLNQLAGMGNALQNNIERVGKKAYAGVAGAIAQGSIPQVTRPGATGIGVGSGYYGGQSAMAIGVSAMSDGGNWVVKGNFSANTDGHVGVGAGALYQW